ncbi:MAG: type 1 glutamine amidotransferase [Rhodobacteraceae bacterium]|nr:MAG: type 1 glutamine amidotransferase [Paracoccaceae bacterium]
MKIGILQTGQAPDALRAAYGDYPALFEALLEGQGFRFVTWHVEAMEFPDSPDQADGWLITGSRHGVYEDHPFIAPLEQFIRDALGGGRPVVGICFGHQIMAQALGGRVEKFAGGWAVGAQEYLLDGRAVTLNAWHQDQVITPPEGARTLASNAFCAHAALAYGKAGLSVQAHPEFDDRFIQGLIDTRGRGVVPEPLLQGAEARKGAARDAPEIARMIVDHFKRVVCSPASSEAT